MSGARRFGDLLVERGFISADQLREALRAQTQERKRLGQILVEMGVLSPDQLNWALSELLGIPYVDLTEEMVDLDLARSMPEDVLRRHMAVPVLRVANELTVILADPTNQQAVMELEALGGTRVRTAMAASETVAKLLDKAFPHGGIATGRVRYAEVSTTPAGTELDALGVAQVFALLIGAFRDHATEIHVEPMPQDVRVRYRVDGRLVEKTRLPRNALGPVLFRFRVLAGLRDESLPTDAHVRTRLEGQEAELDLLFFPTLYGGAVTVNIWRRGAEAPTLDALDLPPDVRRAVSELLAPAGGLVFVTGWEARARAALLYAMAQAVSGPQKKTLTLERGVSFVLPDFVQVEVPGDFGPAAARILAQPTDVAVVEDAASPQTCLAAFVSAERGALVLAGLDFPTNATSLSHLMRLDVPRVSLLAATRGLVHVRRLGLRYWAEVLAMTDELRGQLAGAHRDGHR